MADLLNTNADNYGDDAIVTLSPREHIRLRPPACTSAWWATVRSPTRRSTC